MKPMSLGLFKTYWDDAECPDEDMFFYDCEPEPLLDFDKAYYSVWRDIGTLYHHSNSQPCVNYGMRNKESGKAHGIVRSVFPMGDILEATYKDGQA